MKRPLASRETHSHGEMIISECTMHCGPAVRVNDSALSYLVASLRSTDIPTRCSSMSGLLRLHWKNERDSRMFDIQGMMQRIQNGLPQHVQDVMLSYGFAQCDSTQTLQAGATFQRVINAVFQKTDLYALGKTLAPLILTTEYSIGAGKFEVENGRGGRETFHSSLPFIWWQDSLPHAAKAIRLAGKLEEEDLADILSLKHLLQSGNIKDLLVRATASVKRNPNHAYFYYMLSMTGVAADGLRASKQGLKCTQGLTSFVKFQLMQRAVDHAGNLGVGRSQGAAPGTPQWYTAVAMLKSSLEDAKYLYNTPPDNKYIRNVAYWDIILSFVLKGPEIDEKLEDPEESLNILTLADEFSVVLSGPPANTKNRATQALILDLYPKAIAKWGDYQAHRCPSEPKGSRSTQSRTERRLG